MSTTLDRPRAAAMSMPDAAVTGVPWTLVAVTLASTSVIVGLLWDISWHRTIGRDAFLTPAHLAIYFGAVIAGFSCGALALKTTFAGSPAERAVAVSFWGFKAPLGAWICIWGSFAMLTSAPFDNWWHNAYGLDVQILSPPHALLGVGMIGIELGAMLMVLAQQNRDPAASPALRWLFVYCAGIALLMVATIVWEYTGFPNNMHSALFYRVSAYAFPMFLVAFARAGRLAWPATSVALVYSALTLAMGWILPLFPASARLAPIYNPVTHMMPPTFPLLLIVPAWLIDLTMRSRLGRNDWILGLVIGPLFILTMLAVQWPFAEFLISPAARNPVFLADNWSYSSQLGPWRYEYWDLDRNASGTWSARLFWTGIAVAIAISVVKTWIGLAWGRWMRRVQR